LIVGQIIGAHGLRGEVKVQILTDDPQRFAGLDRLYLGGVDEEPVPCHLLGSRLHKGRALLQLDGCTDRSSAQALRGTLVQVPIDEAIPLEDGEYFEHQIIGLEVRTPAEELLGEVAEIIYTGTNEVYVVKGFGPGRGELLVPAIEGVVLAVDLEKGWLLVELPEGLA
jgi:16S rRNA processing protein RimM